MVNIGKKKGKFFALFSVIVFVFVSIGMMGVVSADCNATELFYKIIDAQNHTSFTDSKKGYGKMDFVLFNPIDDIFTYWLSSDYTKGTASFGANLNIDVIPLTGDYDGDGKADIIVYDYHSGIYYARLSGEGYANLKTLPTGLSNNDPLLGDFNGDGKMDFVLFNPADSLFTYWLSSDYTRGTASFGPNLEINGGEEGTMIVPLTGDYDGDGKADLVIYDPVSGIYYARLSGEGYANLRSIETGLSNNVPLLGDFNGDGKMDFVLFNPTNSLFTYWFSSDYTKGTASFGVVNLEDNFIIPLTGDYDGDGKADLLIYDFASGIYYGRLSGKGYATLESLPTGLSKNIPLLGDFNGECLPPVGYGELKRPPGETCMDSDGGKNYSAKGITKWLVNNQWSFGEEDTCSGNRLAEWYCDGGISGVGAVEYSNCPSGTTCSNGACIASCNPNCAGKNCGPDGCGGSCGTCVQSSPPLNGEQACNSAQQCQTAYWWYKDCDGDFFGDPDTNTAESTHPAHGDFQPERPIICGHDYVRNNTDCNDNNVSINPNATDVCNGVNDNCRDGIDEEGCITSAGWKNLLGVVISEVQINDTVLMSIGGTNLTSNPINYNIFKEGTWFLLFPRISNILSSDSSSWFANVSGNPFNFKANITKNNVLVTIRPSGDLVVNPIYHNSLPVASITAPVNELNISNGTSINFTQYSYDEDDLLKITWDFGDGTTKVITNYINNSGLAGSSNFNTSTSTNVNHTYSSSGRYLVTLSAEEMTRTQKDTKQIYVNVFSSGINVFPVISSPNNETEEQPRVVRFDASKSFVVNCSSENIGSDIITSQSNILYCKYVHAPGTTFPLSGYELKMAWTISSQTPITGNWSSNYNSVVVFEKAFSSKGNQNLSLTITYVASSISKTKGVNRNFNVESLWDCYQPPGSPAYWWDNQHEKVGNCSFKQKEFGFTCCPTGKTCSSDGTCKGYANYCYQYTTQSSCERFVNYVPEKSVGSVCNIKQYYPGSSSKYCSNMTNCLCKWNTNLSKCVDGVNYTNVCWNVNNNGELDITNADYGECLWATTEVIDNCNNSLNNLVTKKKASWVSQTGAVQPAWCKDIEKSYQCVITEKLPFFDKISVIIVIILIIAAYFYVLRKQKKIVNKIKRKINSRKNIKQKRRN